MKYKGIFEMKTRNEAKIVKSFSFQIIFSYNVRNWGLTQLNPRGVWEWDNPAWGQVQCTVYSVYLHSNLYCQEVLVLS